MNESEQIKRIDQLSEQLRGVDRECFDAEGSHDQLFFLACPSGMLAVDANRLPSKSTIEQAIRSVATKHCAFGIIHVCEAWTVKVTGLDVNRLAMGLTVQPSEHPQRTEALMVFVERLGYAAMSQAEITRDGSGKPTLGEWSKWNATGDGLTNYAGRFANLLKSIEEARLHDEQSFGPVGVN